MARIQNGNHVYDEETDQWFSFDSPDEASAYCEQGTHYVTPEVELRASETVGSALLTVGSSPVMLLAADPNREQVHISSLAASSIQFLNIIVGDSNPLQVFTGNGTLMSLVVVNHGTAAAVIDAYSGIIGSNNLFAAANVNGGGTLYAFALGNGLPYAGGVYITVPSWSGSVDVHASYIPSAAQYVLIGDRPSIMSGIGYLLPAGKDITVRSRAELWAVSPTGTIQLSALTEYIK